MGRIKESGFRPQDIVLLLEAIKGSRITMLKYRGLEIVNRPAGSEEWEQLPSTQYEPNTGKKSLAPSDLHATNEGTEYLSKEEQIEHELELLKIEDPVKYEQMLLNGELEDEDAIT